MQLQSKNEELKREKELDELKKTKAYFFDDSDSVSNTSDNCIFVPTKTKNNGKTVY